ncbi:SDR family NAD(P)-dependent oxidoreductase [Microbacterium sp. BK668]|uniref:SDR family NAD(P)-dependent oxidoreductase n=1 Tax=Microbacterium sp. BK668 TaxID=2512118 RepID=UPI00105E1AB6|nr:SDR family NAD(P)-dependent oxidoreductase [Microbacterium sp. BK668]TDN87728.1 short-subunit dehydrogenase [Microbacterium sp. BK668]
MTARSRDGSFEGKVAVVTGAGSGIGRALAVGLAARGARLAVSDIDAERLTATSAMLSRTGADVLAETLDVGDRVAVDAHAARVAEHFGVVHQLYNNAGIATASTFVDDTPVAEFERVFAVNLWGVIHGTQAFLPHLITSGDGHVVNVSSLNGFMAQPRMAPYVTSKFAVRGFTEALRTEMIGRGLPVAVTVVHPGGVRTNIASSVPARSADDRHRAAVYEQKLFRTSAEEAARQILDAVARRRGRVLIGQARRVDRLVRALPSAYPPLIAAWTKRTFGGI